MRRAVLCSLLSILAVSLIAGCADDTKYQFGFRGNWILEQRSLPGGKVLTPPTISGIFEWYPMSKTSAHITASVSTGEDQIQVSTYTIEMAQGDVSGTERVRIHGGYGTAAQPTYQTPNEPVKGSLSVDGNANTLTLKNGMTLSYPDITIAGAEDATFTVTFPDGTVDAWRRTVDQLGVLPK